MAQYVTPCPPNRIDPKTGNCLDPLVVYDVPETEVYYFGGSPSWSGGGGRRHGGGHHGGGHHGGGHHHGHHGIGAIPSSTTGSPLLWGVLALFGGVLFLATR